MSKSETIDYAFAKFENVLDFIRYNRMYENSCKFSVFYEIDEFTYKDGTYVNLKLTSVINKTNCNCTVKFASVEDAEMEVLRLKTEYSICSAFFEGTIYPYHTYNKRSE